MCLFAGTVDDGFHSNSGLMEHDVVPIWKHCAFVITTDKNVANIYYSSEVLKSSMPSICSTYTSIQIPQNRATSRIHRMQGPSAEGLEEIWGYGVI